MLACIATGPTKALKMIVDFPGIYLTPMFTPYIFGPVSTPGNRCQCCCSPKSCGKMGMHLSFIHTYLNILLLGTGSSILVLHFWNDIPTNVIPYIVLPVVLGLCILIGIFHLVEKTKWCCCNFCLPFTIRDPYSPSQEDNIEDEDIEMIEVVHTSEQKKLPKKVPFLGMLVKNKLDNMYE